MQNGASRPNGNSMQKKTSRHVLNLSKSRAASAWLKRCDTNDPMARESATRQYASSAASNAAAGESAARASQQQGESAAERASRPGESVARRVSSRSSQPAVEVAARPSQPLVESAPPHSLPGYRPQQLVWT